MIVIRDEILKKASDVMRCRLMKLLILGIARYDSERKY